MEINWPMEKGKSNNSWGISSIILGILAFILSWIPFFGVVLAIVAIVISGIGLTKKSNKGLVITGLVLGILALLISLAISLVAGVVISAVEFEELGGVSGTGESGSERIYGLNEEVIVGNFAYTFLSVKEKIYLGSNYLKLEPSGVFLIFDIEVENIGNEADYINNEIYIIDNQGRELSQENSAWAYLEDNIIFEELNPGLTKTGQIVFDVPKDIKGKIGIKKGILTNKFEAFVYWS